MFSVTKDWPLKTNLLTYLFFYFNFQVKKTNKKAAWYFLFYIVYNVQPWLSVDESRRFQNIGVYDGAWANFSCFGARTALINPACADEILVIYNVSRFQLILWQRRTNYVQNCLYYYNKRVRLTNCFNYSTELHPVGKQYSRGIIPIMIQLFVLRSFRSKESRRSRPRPEQLLTFF